MKLSTLGFAAITVGLTLCFACGEDSKDTSGAGGNTGAATGGATNNTKTTASATGGGNNTSTATATGGGTSDTPTNDKKCLSSISTTEKVTDAVATCKQFCKIYYKCPDSNADSEATCLDYLGCDEWGTGSTECVEISKVYWACVTAHTSNQCGARTCCDTALGAAMQAACAT
jgi:hypothetical protein